MFTINFFNANGVQLKHKTGTDNAKCLVSPLLPFDDILKIRGLYDSRSLPSPQDRMVAPFEELCIKMRYSRPPVNLWGDKKIASL